MQNHNKKLAHIATNRFGLGAAPGEIEAASADPRAWLFNQFTPPVFTPESTSSNEAIRQVAQYTALKNKAKKAGEESASMMSEDVEALNPRHIYMELVADSLSLSISTPNSFSYRLLDFFSNHFSVSAVNRRMSGLAPTLEREAVAPHLFGHFADMLLAVTRHPAMLYYLNNDQSYGPNSPLAKRNKRRGLNENLAREILELHTLGVDGGYTQEDVIALAKALTGWSIARPKEKSQGFIFRERGHEPGGRKVVGKSYSESGRAQAERILRDLAVHPSTARFVSSKLAQHFVSDEPPASLVSKLEKVWLETDGYLPSVYKALINADESWLITPQKFKTPREFIVSMSRAVGSGKRNPRAARSGKRLINALTELGQRPFDAGSPAGFGDTADAWNGSDAIYRRFEVTSKFTKQVRGRDAKELARLSLGDALSENTATHIRRAESLSQALTLWLMSPEFQRR